jgi:nucleoside phosphorylase
MSPANEFRTIFVDSINRRGRAVLGVTYHVFVDGTEALSATKHRPGRQRVAVNIRDRAIELEARLPGWPAQRISLQPDCNDWIFTFEGAGVPSVLIVCALPKETTAVLATFDEYVGEFPYAPPEDPNKYWVGSFRSDSKPRRALVATCGMGIVSAAITATHALRSFPGDIEQILMVGIAGGCPNYLKPDEHVRLGDVVAADHRGVIQYDFIKRTVDGDEHRANPQRPSREFIEAVQTLEVKRLSSKVPPWEPWIKHGLKALPAFRRPPADGDVLHDGKNVVEHPKDPNRRRGMPWIHRGAIGSANILLKDPGMRDIVRDKWGVRAIEMEASGVLDAGWAMGKDIMVVRGICDYCDSYKNELWQNYAALVAAAYARCLVEALPYRIFP